jgi:hypothetical protein
VEVDQLSSGSTVAYPVGWPDRQKYAGWTIAKWYTDYDPRRAPPAVGSRQGEYRISSTTPEGAATVRAIGTSDEPSRGAHASRIRVVTEYQMFVGRKDRNGQLREKVAVVPWVAFMQFPDVSTGGVVAYVREMEPFRPATGGFTFDPWPRGSV